MRWAQHPKATSAPAPQLALSKVGQRREKGELEGFSPKDRNTPAAKGWLCPAMVGRKVPAATGSPAAHPAQRPGAVPFLAARWVLPREVGALCPSGGLGVGGQAPQSPALLHTIAVTRFSTSSHTAQHPPRHHISPCETRDSNTRELHLTPPSHKGDQQGYTSSPSSCTRSLAPLLPGSVREGQRCPQPLDHISTHRGSSCS